MAIVISGWICSGKSHLIEKFNNGEVTEIPSTYYKYLLTDEQKNAPLESIKSTKREPNPDWPQNYIDAVKDATKKYKIVLVCPGIWLLDMIVEQGVELTLAIPDAGDKEEYKRRSKQRGNNDEFIQRIEDNFEKDRAEMLASSHKKIMMKPGEYLYDALLREGILPIRD